MPRVACSMENMLVIIVLLAGPQRICSRDFAPHRPSFLVGYHKPSAYIHDTLQVMQSSRTGDTFVSMYVCIHVSMYVSCMHVVCMMYVLPPGAYVFMYLCIYVFMYLCMYVCMYVCIASGSVWVRTGVEGLKHSSRACVLPS